MLNKITVSPAPHISANLTTRRVMLDVIIGLLPSMAAALIFFRFRAALILLTCVGACLLSEWICDRIRKKPQTLDDLSAVVTGLILGMSLPPAIPVFVAVIGSVLAIVIVKMLFGGLGSNVFNPAMAARAFLTATFGVAMTTWTVPATTDSAMPILSAASPAAITQATPLAWSKMAQKKEAKAQEANSMTVNAFWGNRGGCLGETSAAALIIGGVYLLIRKTISWHIPASVLLSAGAVSLAAWLLRPEQYASPLLHLFGGGMMIGAFFIATDPVTAPLTVKGRWLFGIGVGGLIMLIRLVGEYPEGVMYAVLIMNALSPLIDRFCKRIPAGGLPNV